MRYIIGIDGGGTKTLGYIGNDAGRILSKRISGPSNYQSIGIEKTKENIKELLLGLCEDANISIDDIVVVSAGMAGVNRPEDKKIVTELFRSIGFNGEIILNNDAKTALVGGILKEEGVITICGTGSISLGMKEDGETVRAGGWGHLISDEGSGYYLGIKTVEAVMKSHDLRSEKTVLTDKVIKLLDLQKPEDLISYIYNDKNSKQDIAKIAPVLVEAVYENDKIALEIFDQAVKQIVDITYTVVNRLKNDSGKIYVTYGGGILQNVEIFRTEFKKRLMKKSEYIEVKNPLFDSGVGAMIIGWNHLNVEYNVDTIKNDIEK